MLQRLKGYILLALVIGAFYFLLSHHILFDGPTSFHLLPKTELSLKYTFVSLRSTPPEELMRNEDLLDGGVDELLVEEGYLTQAEANRILRQIARE